MTRTRLNHNIRAFAHGTLGLDVEQYRDVIRQVTTNKEHITDCTGTEAELVLTALRRIHDGRLRSTPQRGTQPGRPPTRDGVSTRRSSGAANRDPGGERQHSILPRLMELLRWDWGSTAKFCKTITGKKRTDKCDARELSKVIAGMVQVIEHDLTIGKITMTDKQLQEFRMHTQPRRKKEAA